jgi:inhibitor of growth protein 4
MNSGTYLDKYLDSVSNLPSEVKRNFTLMQELDAQCQGLLDKLEQSTRNYLKKKRDNPELADERTLIKIREDFQKAMQHGDEKVELAVQTYELVDKHIRRLDTELKKFESELEQERKKAKGSGSITAGKGTKASKQQMKETTGKAQKRGCQLLARATSSASEGGYASPSEAPRLFNVDIDMPIDPNEPTYCICNRVSFVEMVGCDNPDCKVEWFHFECVGLTSPPKGKWYCPECAALRKKQLLKK